MNLMNKIETNEFYGQLRSVNQILFLEKEINIIGRGNSVNLMINHVSISKEHASIEFDKTGEVILRDLNSTNGCYLNDQRIKDGNFVKIKNNDKIKFGKDPSIYIFEKNLSMFNIIDNSIDENNNTVQYPSIIKDEKISLVSDENYSKATRNHFDKKIKESIQQASNTKLNNNKIDNKNKNLINSQTSLLESPKFNSLIKEDEIEIDKESNAYHDLNMTFKNSKNSISENIYRKNNNNSKSNSISDSNTKTVEDILRKIEKLTAENENLQNKNFSVEEKILEKTNELKKLSNTSEILNEELSKLNAKHNALLIYASDTQKKVDLLEMQLNEKNLELAKYIGLDWAKLLLEKENIIKVLQIDAGIAKQELQKLKSNLMSNTKGNDGMKRIDSLLENYMQENKKYKKILDEYKLRENECNKKWNELLKENNTNIEKINLLHRQLNDQNEQFNRLISEYDKKLHQNFEKFPRLMQNMDNKKSEAAQYLVEQTNLIMEEKRKLKEQNCLLENQLEILIFDNEKLKLDLRNMSMYFDNNSNNLFNGSFNTNFNSNNSNVNIKQMRLKIEELEDLITQDKNTNSPNKIVELEETIISLNCRISEKDKQIEMLNAKLKENLKRIGMVFDERQIVNSLSQTLRDKDIMIINLKNQMKEMREIEKVKNNEIENLNKFVDKQSLDNTNLYSFEDVITSKDKNFNPSLYIDKIENLCDELS